MIILTLIFCSISGCEPWDAPETYTSPMACMMAGETTAARYQSNHPGMILHSWRCGTKREDGA